MNVARVLILIIALAAGGIAAYLALNLIQQDPDPVAPAEVAAPITIQSEEVLVAAGDIPLGGTIEPTGLTWQQWPSTGLNATYIRRSENPRAIEELSSSIARVAILEGEPVTEAKLARTDGGLLSALLPAGMRAIAVSISAETSAGGFILPNDRVDVIMTRLLRDEAGVEHYDTETILQNIRILAIDQQIEDQNGQQVVVGRTATLELSPQQAEIMTVAQQMSDRLALSLRSIADSSQVQNPDADAVHLLAAENSPEAGGITVVRNGVAQQVTPGQ